MCFDQSSRCQKGIKVAVEFGGRERSPSSRGFSYEWQLRLASLLGSGNTDLHVVKCFKTVSGVQVTKGKIGIDLERKLIIHEEADPR